MTLLTLSFIGFIIKLPAIFRSHDRELHFLFYLLFALFLTLLCAQKKVLNHILISFFLFLFGIGIEWMQEISNKILHKKIHGRFDPEDVFFNALGLVCASGFWFTYLIVNKILNSNNNENPH
ncbi:MAG: hypothetical protein FJZ66_02300 [Bacteroidetes bacterium]|nr:hypothetical protein [Bacteroidota bacterium]